jgi:hypothetical protein
MAIAHKVTPKGRYVGSTSEPLKVTGSACHVTIQMGPYRLMLSAGEFHRMANEGVDRMKWAGEADESAGMERGTHSWGYVV